MTNKFINFDIFLDKGNYLINFNIWTYDIANFIASRESIVLTSKHFVLINLLRNFYIKNKVYPNARIIITMLKKNKNLLFIDSSYINFLFPGNSIEKLIKISGLPNLSNCI